MSGKNQEVNTKSNEAAPHEVSDVAKKAGAALNNQAYKDLDDWSKTFNAAGKGAKDIAHGIDLSANPYGNGKQGVPEIGDIKNVAGELKDVLKDHIDLRSNIVLNPMDRLDRAAYDQPASGKEPTTMDKIGSTRSRTEKSVRQRI